MVNHFFKKMGHPQPLLLYFRLFNAVDRKMFIINFCQKRDSNRGPLELEVTALPTEPQPLPIVVNLSNDDNLQL